MAQESAQNVPSMTPPNASFDAASLDDDFELAEKRFAAKYEVLEKLGEGTYGSVFKAREKRTGGAFAMKIMKLGSGEDGVPSTAIREIAVLKELSHVNVVRLLDVFCKPAKLVLVFEYLENDLKKYMKTLGGRLTPAIVKSLAFQLCRGLEFCHASRIIHRDLKPQNLLIDNRLHMKIADFGLARAFSLPLPIYTHEVVTVWYRPPEILLGSTTYAPPVDVWAVGTILVEMVSKRPLFPGDCEIDQIYKILRLLGTPAENVWPGCTALQDWNPAFPQWPRLALSSVSAGLSPAGLDLLERTLFYDPKARISARAAMNHPFFDDINKEV